MCEVVSAAGFVLIMLDIDIISITVRAYMELNHCIVIFKSPKVIVRLLWSSVGSHTLLANHLCYIGMIVSFLVDSKPRGSRFDPGWADYVCRMIIDEMINKNKTHVYKISGATTQVVCLLRANKACDVLHSSLMKVNVELSIPVAYQYG